MSSTKRKKEQQKKNRAQKRPPPQGLRLRPSARSIVPPTLSFRLELSALFNQTVMGVDRRDPDGDSEMASSVGSVHSDSDNPDHGARTPTRLAQSSAVAAAELSPPGQTDKEASGAAIAKQAAEWKTKAESQRAWEHVIDRDFTLDQFGDPFDERDMQ
ncbi:hypothetical protein N7468_010286 [Penicillium chermesinum]|uniref:Uncharacterized protein n=1 Tax=Penicillium chermesinum TaxID=63820 RepID=A0A9W9TC48_9EURO|nr:uncharacterized protein N7468_010286 [Penicillium chermesinum]KAJ5217278.1 hypothetical protein N7468_010286 [Penicillium chermesinum]